MRTRACTPPAWRRRDARLFQERVAPRLNARLFPAGGEQQRPWWRARWIEQLRGLRQRIRDKLAALQRKRAGAAAAAEPPLTPEEEALQAEARRLRVQEQLGGLAQRSQRRTRRRPPSSATPNEW